MDNISYAGRPLDLKEFVKYSKTFVETGTCVGDGAKRAMDAGFIQILSCEIHRPYHDQACERLIPKGESIFKQGNYGGRMFPGVKQQIALFFGNTLDLLPQMLTFDPHPVIFLDAHPSGPGTAGHDDLMEKGEGSEWHQDNIICKELEIIFKATSDAIIMIDDMNGLNESSQKHIDKIRAYNPEYKFFFYHQDLGTNHYKDKILVCVP